MNLNLIVNPLKLDSVPAYVSEVTEDRIRGTLGTVMILMLVFGIEFT